MKSKIKNKLNGIYSQIPNPHCTGACIDACTAIGCTSGEAEVLEEMAGKKPFINLGGHCGYLKDGRCSVYQARPTICRLFGAVEDLTCPFGCEPKKYLTKEQADRIISDVEQLTGNGQIVISDLPPSITGAPVNAEQRKIIGDKK